MNLEIKKEKDFEYVEVGRGPALILLHGLFGALSNFKDVIDRFKDRYTVLVPLMPLFKLPIPDTNVQSLYLYVDGFIKHKNLSNIILLGNSLGGHVALIYASKNQENLKGLVLTGSSGLYENSLGGSYPRKDDKEFIRGRVAYTFFDPKHATDELVDEVFGILNDREKAIRIIALAKSAIRHNMKEELPKIKTPTLLIWGKNDTITPPEVGNEFSELIPNSTLHWIDKCGHAPMMEHPEEFNSILDQWIEEKLK